MGRIVDRVVISLPGSARTHRFLSQPQAAGFRVHSAFDGRSGAGRDRIDVPAFIARYGREPMGGQIGCALSHADLLAAFADASGPDDDLPLVAEDDAVLSEDASAVIQNVSSTRKPDFALLAQPHEDPRADPFWSKSRDLANLFLLARPVGPGPWRFRCRSGRAEGGIYGTGLYLVSRQAARALTSSARTEGLSRVADDYRSWRQSVGVDLLVLRPTIAGWRGGSDINAGYRPHCAGERRPGSLIGLRSWKRRAARFKGGARVAWHEVTHRLKD